MLGRPSPTPNDCHDHLAGGLPRGRRQRGRFRAPDAPVRRGPQEAVLLAQPGDRHRGQSGARADVDPALRLAQPQASARRAHPQPAAGVRVQAGDLERPHRLGPGHLLEAPGDEPVQAVDPAGPEDAVGGLLREAPHVRRRCREGEAAWRLAGPVPGEDRTRRPRPDLPPRVLEQREDRQGMRQQARPATRLADVEAGTVGARPQAARPVHEHRLRVREALGHAGRRGGAAADLVEPVAVGCHVDDAVVPDGQRLEARRREPLRGAEAREAARAQPDEAAPVRAHPQVGLPVLEHAAHVVRREPALERRSGASSRPVRCGRGPGCTSSTTGTRASPRRATRTRPPAR